MCRNEKQYFVQEGWEKKCQIFCRVWRCLQTSLHCRPVGPGRCLPWRSRWKAECQMRVVYTSSFCGIVLPHDRSLTSSSTQYIPDVSFRTGSRAGRGWCQSVTYQQLQVWGRKKKQLTLKAAIDEMLSPLHLFCSHLLNDVQILKGGGNIADSWDPRQLMIIRGALCSPAEAEFLMRWGHLSCEPERVSLGQPEEDEAPAGSHRCTGSLPAAQGRKSFHRNIPGSHVS